MGDPKKFRDPENLRSQLQNMGDPRSVRALLEGVHQGPPAATVRDFATHLGRLAIQYWRPDFTPEQAKVLYGDFIRLLAGITAAELSTAVDAWMMDPANRFFPTPGMLHAKLRDQLRDRVLQRSGAEYLLGILDGRDVPDHSHGKLRSVAEILAERNLSMPVAAADAPPEPINTARPESAEGAVELRAALAANQKTEKADT